MAVILDRDQGLLLGGDEQIRLECPYCGVYAHISPESVPNTDELLRHRPAQVGVVGRCNACQAPVFLRFAVKKFGDTQVELDRDFIELERPKEKFAFSYLPERTQTLFREALACYSTNSFNAFALMCRRSATSAFEALGEGGKLRAFEEVMVAQEIARIDDESFAPIKTILFDTGDEEALPVLTRAQAGVLLEVLKDMFYQCFVRHGKLTRALKVRRFFVQEGGRDKQTMA
jgi:hypothetical protein